MENNGIDTQFRVPKAAEVVAGKIRAAIVRGELKAGGNMPSEAQLIAMFQISRPTIREAVRILEFENLIRVSRGARGGAKIQHPSSDFVTRAMGVSLQNFGVTLADIYRARSIIEPPAAREAAENNSVEAVKALRAQIQVEYDALEKAPVIPLETAEFHRLLVEQSGNKTLALVASALRGVVERHQSLVHRNHPPEKAEKQRKQSILGIRSQEKLIDLIEKKDAEGAETHWRSHMHNAGVFWLDRLGKKTVLDVLDL